MLDDAEQPPVPMGLAQALIQPPFIWILILIMALGVFAVLAHVFKEEMQPYLYILMDCMATMMRGVNVCCKSLFWCSQRACYPVKELLFSGMDAYDKWRNPYKRRTPTGTGVPTFAF
mmetsp:Transcript_55055/g.144807  ORF Transcript_55055/g.144807 Transcript_55055/m.144807 type:complete len:117 (-) Transcript_55055:163-513(-)